MAPFGILFAIVFIIPIFYAIYSSFFRQVTEGGGAYGGGELVNKFVGFQNFEYVLTSGDFWSGVGRVLIYTLIQVPLMIVIALALAMVIDSFVVKHITGFRLGYFLPYAIPGVVASIIWVYLYNGQISPIVKGLAAIGINVDFFSKNIVLASMANITTWTFTGYNMLIFLAALQAIPHELYEAARIDGASDGRSPRALNCRTCVPLRCCPCCCPSSAQSSCSTNRRSCRPLIRASPKPIRQ